MKLRILVPLIAFSSLVPKLAPQPDPFPELAQDKGYTDTPLLPGQTWRVHDAARPAPAAVTPGEGAAPPSDALVLFDGSGLGAWTGGPWTVESGALVVNGKGSLSTKESFGDCQLHLEWATPSAVQGSSQGRGNSGVFLMGRYEVQVLDSYENATYADGQAAALYGQYPPDVNASRGPGAWQTYDIFFKAPRFEGAALVEPALVTVVHNGVLVHHARAFLGATRHKEVAQYEAHPAQLPLELQDHGNPVRFRNIWIRRL
jgi:3-keto-disaccharide hydrolase